MVGEQLRPVPLQEMRHLEAGRQWQIDQPIAGLASLTPVRGQLHATHLGNVLEVEGEAETIVTLCCDRCLKHFNLPLRANTKELLWIGEPALNTSGPTASADCTATEGEADDSGLMEQLDPRGDFDPEHWVFEQLNLLLPIVNHCGIDCPGPATWSSDGYSGDTRWRGLQGLCS